MKYGTGRRFIAATKRVKCQFRTNATEVEIEDTMRFLHLNVHLIVYANK